MKLIDCLYIGDVFIQIYQTESATWKMEETNDVSGEHRTHTYKNFDSIIHRINRLSFQDV